MVSDGLRAKLLAFRTEREWEQFHNLRTLSTSLMLEAAELAEHTQWAPDSEIDRLATERREQITQEVADMAILLTYLVSDLGIDLEAAVDAKLAFNAERYPVEKARGTAKKYDEL